MSAYPPNAGSLNYITYPVGPTVPGSTLTANASNNTKGSYVQFIASSPFAAAQEFVKLTTQPSATQNILVDVATGAAASEVVVIANIAASQAGTITTTTAGAWQFSLTIAASTRIAMRMQSTIGGNTCAATITLIATGGMVGLSNTETIGVSTSTSLGTQIDPGGTANTKGSYSQISASTGLVYQYLALILSNPGHGNLSGAAWCMDVATGAAASEVVLIPDLRMDGVSAGAATVEIAAPTGWSLITYIAASTRIAVRASCSINTATTRLFDASIVGGPASPESAGGGGAWGFA